MEKQTKKLLQLERKIKTATKEGIMFCPKCRKNDKIIVTSMPHAYPRYTCGYCGYSGNFPTKSKIKI